MIVRRNWFMYRSGRKDFRRFGVNWLDCQRHFISVLQAVQENRNLKR